MAFAIATFPKRLRSNACSLGSVEVLSLALTNASTMLSMRLMKKLATLATWLTSPPEAAYVVNPAMYADATFSYSSMANSNVTLMLMPSLMHC